MFFYPKEEEQYQIKENLREGIREQAQWQVIPLWPFKTLKKECPVYLKEKESINHFLIVKYLVVDFTIYGGWIPGPLPVIPYRI